MTLNDSDILQIGVKMSTIKGNYWRIKNLASVIILLYCSKHQKKKKKEMIGNLKVLCQKYICPVF